MEKSLDAVNSGLDVVNNTLAQLAEQPQQHARRHTTSSSSSSVAAVMVRDPNSLQDGDFVEPVGNLTKAGGAGASSNVRYSASDGDSDTWNDGALVEPWFLSVPANSN